MGTPGVGSCPAAKGRPLPVFTVPLYQHLGEERLERVVAAVGTGSASCRRPSGSLRRHRGSAPRKRRSPTGLERGTGAPPSRRRPPSSSAASRAPTAPRFGRSAAPGPAAPRLRGYGGADKGRKTAPPSHTGVRWKPTSRTVSGPPAHDIEAACQRGVLADVEAVEGGANTRASMPASASSRRARARAWATCRRPFR